MPRSSSVFSRSARILEEMRYANLVNSSRKCQRLPNIMSRITSRLHLSPTTSRVRLIGQPERRSVSVIGWVPGARRKSPRKNHLQCRTSNPRMQPDYAIGIRYTHGTHAALPSAGVVLLEG